MGLILGASLNDWNNLVPQLSIGQIFWQWNPDGDFTVQHFCKPLKNLLPLCKGVAEKGMF